MNERAQSLKSIRPEFASTTIHDNMTADERFQNLVLRPVIKLQHNLLMGAFKNYIAKHKNVFFELSLEKRIDYIENAIHKNMKFRNSLKGMIIGMFTMEEYQIYTKNSSALNKRMMNIVKERFLSNIQLFDKPEFLTAV
ncbi:MAG: glyoxalase [Flavobacteriaceae bacterium]|nr:glyoxalase [Flavobacteriaceae bacterium]